jgi:hypothetical protein
MNHYSKVTKDLIKLLKEIRQEGLVPPHWEPLVNEFLRSKEPLPEDIFGYRKDIVKAPYPDQAHCMNDAADAMYRLSYMNDGELRLHWLEPGMVAIAIKDARELLNKQIKQ